MYCYFLDHDGTRILILPRPLTPNYEGMEPVDLLKYPATHAYAKVVQDANHFYKTAGEGAAALIYDIHGRFAEGPVLLGTFWLKGPAAA